MHNTDNHTGKSTFINSHWIKGNGPLLISTTPDETQVLWKKNASSPAQVIEAVNTARLAQKRWTNATLKARIDTIKRFGDLLNENKSVLAEILSVETGKPLWESITEITACFNKIDISIRAQKERAGSHKKAHMTLQHNAHGVMAVFGPFNFPMHLPNGHIVPALLAGNSVVFKPSELTPLCAERYNELWIKAGLPEGVLNLVQGGAEVGKALVNSDINGILFTGSYNTGKIIHQQLAGKPEILLALEMGGNNPMIVGETGDIDLAVNTIIHSAFLSAGQRCTCTRRLILINSSMTDPLIEKLVKQSERITLSNDAEARTPFMGPVISVTNAKNLLKAQESLIRNGGTPLKKMTSTDRSTVYLSPGIIDITYNQQVSDEEYFGPLLQLIRVDSFDEAIDVANATRFGLAAGLISDNETEKSHFRNNIKAGIVSVNLPTAGASSELPFGGIGSSGNHRPSAYYAADYSAWPQAISEGDTLEQMANLDLNNIRGLR